MRKGYIMDSRPSILIVDDEKNIRLTLSQALEDLGAFIDTAFNGEEALTKLAGGIFTLVLLDMKLPGMEGMKVLEKLREIRPDIKVIIITAYGTIDSAVEAMKLGAVDFIQKPFAPEEIRSLVRQVIDRTTLDEQKANDYASYIELAKKCINERLFKAADVYVRNAITIDNSRPEAFNLLGALKEIGSDYTEAQKFYRVALDLDATYEPAQKNLSRTTAWNREGEIIIDSGNRETEGQKKG